VSIPKVLVLGHTGFLGKRVLETFRAHGFEVIGASRQTGIDLRIPNVLDGLVEKSSPDILVNCSATVGGIEFSRSHQVELFRDNLFMILSILDTASRFGLKIINPMPNCVYPRDLTVFSEEKLWDGVLDESVVVYGSVRKLGWIGILAYEQQLDLQSTNLVFPNLYGPGDHLDPVRAHALGGLVYRLILAQAARDKQFEVWGSGNPVREWMFIDDACQAILRATEVKTNSDPINVGTGVGISIKELTFEIAKQVGFRGKIIFNTSKPDGAPHKTMDGSKGETLLNWKPQVDFQTGLGRTIDWYKQRISYQVK
jgi:GDP-L-fucose synthase